LWIDDEVPRSVGSVRLLELELSGLHVDCAESGAEGLRRARTGEYAAIILDLKLPDIDGLTVLERMRAAGLDMPVLVLTGWADTESTVKAMKLGAVDVRDKPLTSDDFIEAIRALLVLGARSGSRGPRSLLARVDTEPISDLPLISETARALTDETLPGLPFVILARSFRASLGGRDSCIQADRDVAASGYKRDERLTGIARTETTESDRETAEQIIIAIEADLAAGTVPSEEQIAVRLSMSRSDVHDILKANTGADFCEIRRTLRVRSAVRELACSLEQIAQIAYRLGYEHPSQFDRDFTHILGLTPRRWRSYFR
jgi:YesN/AraC family two-component response regulator